MKSLVRKKLLVDNGKMLLNEIYYDNHHQYLHFQVVVNVILLMAPVDIVPHDSLFVSSLSALPFVLERCRLKLKNVD